MEWVTKWLYLNNKLGPELFLILQKCKNIIPVQYLFLFSISDLPLCFELLTKLNKKSKHITLNSDSYDLTSNWFN